MSRGEELTRGHGALGATVCCGRNPAGAGGVANMRGARRWGGREEEEGPKPPPHPLLQRWRCFGCGSGGDGGALVHSPSVVGAAAQRRGCAAPAQAGLGVQVFGFWYYFVLLVVLRSQRWFRIGRHQQATLRWLSLGVSPPKLGDRAWNLSGNIGIWRQRS